MGPPGAEEAGGEQFVGGRHALAGRRRWLEVYPGVAGAQQRKDGATVYTYIGTLGGFVVE